MAFVTDQKLKSYFLGILAREEAERLEEECAADAELMERANIVESELADDYWRKNLSGEERRLYEENYLTTEARRGKLRQTVNLWKVADEDRSAAKTPAPSFWQTLFASRRLLAFGSLAAIIIGGGLILIRLNLKQSPEIAKSQNTSQSLNTETKNQDNSESRNVNIINSDSNINAGSENYNNRKSGNVNVPKPEVRTTPKPVVAPVPTLATFTLAPGTLRSEGEQFIKIPAKTSEINLRLKMPKDAPKYRTYRAVLQTADGEIVFAATKLKSPEFFLPAAKLENQTYLVLLEGRNAADQTESVAEYTFRVNR